MLTYGRSSEYSSIQNQNNYRDGEALSVRHFLGADLPGDLMHVDLPALGTDFAIPIFIVQGKYDLRTPPDLTKTILTALPRLRSNFSWCRKQPMSPRQLRGTCSPRSF